MGLFLCLTKYNKYVNIKLIKFFSNNKTKAMKAVIFALVFIFVAVVSIKAQPHHPVRSAMNLTIGAKVQAVPDSLIRKYYPNGISPSVVAIRVTEPDGRNLRVFMASRDEYEFLKKQVQNVGIQIVLDDEYFIGYTKMLIY